MTQTATLTSAIKRPAGTGEARWWPGVLATIKVGAADSDGQTAVIEMITPTGLGAPPHARRRVRGSRRSLRPPLPKSNASTL